MKYVLMITLFVAGTLDTAAVNGELTPASTRSCESLTSLTLPNTTITRAEAVEAGAFTPPARWADADCCPPRRRPFAACRRSAVWPRR